MNKAILFAAALLLSACGAQYRDTSQPMLAKPDWDTAQYVGNWYEIARFPVIFQDGCVATKATYGVIDEDTVSVLNECRDGALDGPLRQIDGTAEILAPGQLKVRFSNIPFIRGDYWVLWVDRTYQTAVVGVPNGRAGWILARTPNISPQKRSDAEEVLRGAGYDVSRLIDVPQPSS